jgi:hypothetical protein
MFWVETIEEDDGGSTPVINQQINLSILVEISRKTAHGRGGLLIDP